MRSVKQRNGKKKSKQGTRKRTRRRKSNEIIMRSRVKNEVSFMSLDDMNDVIRVVKTERVKCKRWWKVMPKDSCEVYKDRKRRSNEQDDNYTTDESGSQEDRRGGRKKKQRKDSQSDKEVRFRKSKKRSSPSSHSSASSATVSTMSTSVSTTSTERDYE